MIIHCNYMDTGKNSIMVQWFAPFAVIGVMCKTKISASIRIVTVFFILMIGVTVSAQQSNCRLSADNVSNASLAVQVREQRLALAIFQLGIAIRTYRPFVQELSLVQKLGIAEGRLREPIDNLSPHAATGVATINELRDSFGVILLPKLEALSETNEMSWSGEVWHWFLKTIVPSWSDSRQTPATEFRQTLVRSAMDRLSEDNLRGAVELLTQLDEPGAQITARWIIEANARLSLDAAYESLSEIITTLLSCAP